MADEDLGQASAAVEGPETVDRHAILRTLRHELRTAINHIVCPEPEL